MINPTKKDIGRRVIYTPIRGPKEYGVITSFNDWSVFVRYGAKTCSEATAREDLTWERETADR